MDFFSLEQFIGYFAVLIGGISYFQKTDEKLKYFQGFATIIWACHYFLMGLFAASVICVIISIRQFISSKTHNYTHTLRLNIFIVFSLLFCIATYFTWKDYFSLIPLVTALMANYALLFSGGLKMRVILFGCDIGWVIYNIAGNSIGGLIGCAVNMVANIVVMKKMKKAKS